MRGEEITVIRKAMNKNDVIFLSCSAHFERPVV